MIFLDSSVGLGINFVGALIFGEQLPSFTNQSWWYWILAFSALTMITSLFLVKGFKLVEAQIGSLILPTEIFFGSLFGFLIFKEVLGLNVYLGGLLIFVAAIVPGIFAFKKWLLRLLGLPRLK